MAEVRDRPGALPVLSTALVRTWEHRDGDILSVASYRAGGGVEAALQRVGEEAWATLEDDEQRAACRRLLLRLAVNEDGSWVRRWARRADLVRSDAAAAAALAVLVDRRLVVARADDLGIAHEALLTGWPRLRGWLDDWRARADVPERLTAATTAWEQSDRDPAEVYRGTRLQAALDLAAASPDDLTPLENAFLAESTEEANRQLSQQRARADREARGRRRARLVAAVLAVTLAFAASAGGYAIIQQRNAERAALRAPTPAGSGRSPEPAAITTCPSCSRRRPWRSIRHPRTESDLFATLLRGDGVVATLRAPGRAHSIALTPDSSSVVAVTDSGDLVRWPIGGGPATTLSRLGQQPGEFSFNGVLRVGGQIAVAGDGRIVVGSSSGPADSSLQTLDAGTFRVLQQVPIDGFVGWALSRDGRLAVATPPGSISDPESDVLIWPVGAAAVAVRRVRAGGRPLRIVACGADTACVLTDRQLVRIRMSSATVEGRLQLPPRTVDPSRPETVEQLVASPDGRILAIASADESLLLVDARSGRVREFRGAFSDLHALAFSPDGSRVVAGDYASVLIWRTDGTGTAERHEVHGGRVVSAEWSRDGSTLATLGRDGDVVLLDMTGRRRVGAVVTDALQARTTTLWATPRAVVVGQDDGGLLFVDPADGSVHPAGDSPHGTNAIDSARAAPTGNLLVTSDYLGGTAVWDVATRRLLGTIDLPTVPSIFATVTSVSPDGRRAATIRDPRGPVIVDLLTRQVLRQLPPLPPPDANLEVSVQGWTPDGRSILISRQLSNTTSDVLVVDAATGAVEVRMNTNADLPMDAVADPTGRYIAVGAASGRLLILDAKDGHALAPALQADDGPVLNVSVSPDGRYISTAGQPPRLAVWDTRTFRQVAVPLPVDVSAVEARARFAPDGRLFVTSGSVLRAFTIDPAQWLARACREAGRTLTRDEFAEVLPGRPYTPACS